MRTGIEVESLDESELLEVAMIIFNIDEQLNEKTSLATLEADYRNWKNPFYLAMLPNLDRMHPMTGDEIPGNEAFLYWIEEDLLIKLSEAGILTYKTTNKTVEDIFETGRPGKLPVSYQIVVNLEKYKDYSTKVLRAAKSKMSVPAILSFEKFSTPLVTSQGKEYPLTTMRNGTAFDIVVNCFEKHPNEAVSLKELKETLSLSGVKNINDALRKSHFDGSTGLLRSFVESSPQFIKVKPNVDLPLSQFEDIETASKKL